MTYITYGVKVTAISKLDVPTQTFLHHIIDPNVGISDEERDDEYWAEVAGDMLYNAIEDGDVPEYELEGNTINDDDWTYVVSYGVFRVEVEGSRLAVA